MTIHSIDTKQESVVEIEAVWKDMALRIGEPAKNVKVHPQESATFLVYHSDRDDYSRKDQFILDVDSKHVYSEDICMIVGVYNKECPLKNKPENIKVFIKSSLLFKWAYLSGAGEGT